MPTELIPIQIGTYNLAQDQIARLNLQHEPEATILEPIIQAPEEVVALQEAAETTSRLQAEAVVQPIQSLLVLVLQKPEAQAALLQDLLHLQGVLEVDLQDEVVTRFSDL